MHPSADQSHMPVAGHHWLLDFSGCDCALELLARSSALEQQCLQACQQAGLNVVGKLFHQFHPDGVTGVVLLAESHLSVHTWPNERFVAVDVYVCNHGADNLAKGQMLADRMVALFQPGETVRRELPRQSVRALAMAPPSS